MSKVEFHVEYSVQDLYDRMTYSQSMDMAALLDKGGYIPRNLFAPEVGEWYDNATEGQLNHMGNKLAKNGYPVEGIHSKEQIRVEAYAKGCKHGTTLAKLTRPRTLRKTLEQHTTAYIIRTMKELGVSPTEIVQAAVRLQE